MTYQETEILIQKYLNGETTPDEERLLALEVSREDAPQEWSIIAEMLGELTIDEALFDQIMEERNRKPRIIKMWPWAAAACIIGILIMVFTPPRSADKTPLVAESKPAVEVPTTVEKLEVKAAEPKVETIEKPKVVTRHKPAPKKVVTDKPAETAEEEPVRMSEATRLEIMLASTKSPRRRMSDEEFQNDINEFRKMGERILDSWDNN